MNGFVQLFRFMTRIPIGYDPKFNNEALGKSMKYFPIVGIVLGIITFLFYYIFYLILGEINIVMIVFIILIELILTGGIHLDGLADTFDGIFSYRSKQKMLEIMKDSRLGTNGAIALIFYFLLKFSMYYACGNMLGVVILISPVVARLCSVINCNFAPYARPTGMGKTFVDNSTCGGVILATLITFIYCVEALYIFKLSFVYLWTIPITMFLGYLFAKLMTKKIGGITGDTLGAVLELSQLVEILLIYIFLVRGL